MTHEKYDSTKRHYWVREDFDQLMGQLPGADDEDWWARPEARSSSMSLVYPKTTEGAFRELRLRGLYVDGIYLWQLAQRGIVQPRGARPCMTWTGEDGLEWSKEDIDQAAEWIYANDETKWSSWTHFCWVGNLSFGQCAQAARVAAARYGLGLSVGWDVLGLVVVIEPASDPDDYARIRLLPKDTEIKLSEAER